MLRKLLPHAAIIISAMYFVFFFIDRVNPAMAFINNDLTKVLLCVFCVISIVNAVLLIRSNRARARRHQQLSEKQMQKRAARGLFHRIKRGCEKRFSFFRSSASLDFKSVPSFQWSSPASLGKANRLHHSGNGAAPLL